MSESSAIFRHCFRNSTLSTEGVCVSLSLFKHLPNRYTIPQSGVEQTQDGTGPVSLALNASQSSQWSLLT